MKRKIKNLIVFIFIIIYFLPALVVSQEFPSSQVSNRISTPEELSLKDWVIVNSLIGDLSGDNKDDLVFVLKHIGDDTNSPSTPRVLLIYFRDKNKFNLVELNKNFILKRDEGGLMGDPFQSIEINKGSLLIKHSGGSRERWSYIHRFNYRSNNFYLIGTTESNFDSLEGSSLTKDTNLINGNQEIISKKSNGKSIKKLTTLPIKPLKTIKESEVFQ